MDEKHKEAQKAMDRVIKEVELNCSCMLEFPHWHWISMDSAYNDRLVVCGRGDNCNRFHHRPIMAKPDGKASI